MRDARGTGVATTEPSNRPIRKVPAAGRSAEIHVRSRGFSSVRDLYLDDVEAVYAVLVDACAQVEMESDEYANITIENIGEIKAQTLTGFCFRTLKPSARITIGPSDYVSLTVYGNAPGAEMLFDRLCVLLRQWQRPVARKLHLTTSLFWMAIGLGGLLAVIAVGDGLPKTGQYAAAALMLLLAIGPPFRSTFAGPHPVVYPVWKREARPQLHIHWRDKAIDLIQGALLVILGFLLGKYF